MPKEDKTIKGVHHYLSQVIELEEGENTSDVEVLRTGTLFDRGFTITKKMLNAYVKNFQDDVYGTKVQVNLEHRRGSEAAGWVNDLFLKGNKLFAKVEWTELGIEKIQKKLFQFVSAELAGIYPHHKNGEEIAHVFIGLALTNTPAMKRQAPLALSEELTILFNETHMFKTMLNDFLERSIVLKEDKALLRNVFNSLSEEEQEEHKDQVEEVEAKPEAEEKEEKPEGGDEPTGDSLVGGDAGEKEEKEEGGEDAELSSNPQFIALKEENARLVERALRQDLTEEVKAKLFVSKENKVGIVQTDLSEAVDFLASLNEAQRAQYFALQNKFKHVPLSEIGSTQTGEATPQSEDDAKLMEKARKMSEETGRALHECLADLYSAKNKAEKSATA